MTSCIVTPHWTSPEQGASASVVEMTDLEWEVFSRAVSEIEGARAEAGDLGAEIAMVNVSATGASGADVHGLRDALEFLADGCRYSTGEALYDEDLPTFAAYGIARS